MWEMVCDRTDNVLYILANRYDSGMGPITIVIVKIHYNYNFL